MVITTAVVALNSFLISSVILPSFGSLKMQLKHHFRSNFYSLNFGGPTLSLISVKISVKDLKSFQYFCSEVFNSKRNVVYLLKPFEINSTILQNILEVSSSTYFEESKIFDKRFERSTPWSKWPTTVVWKKQLKI